MLPPVLDYRQWHDVAIVVPVVLSRRLLIKSGYCDLPPLSGPF